MIAWDWLREINLMNTACVMTNESSQRFRDSDYNKHLPEKLLKSFFINIIETHCIDFFIIPLLTRFQLAAGSVLIQLKRKYPHIKIIIIGFSEINTNFSRKYLHIIWRLKGKASRYVDITIDNDIPFDLLKSEISEYIYSLDTVLITEDFDIGAFNNHWKLEKLQENQPQENTMYDFQQLFLAEECVVNIDNAFHDKNTDERQRQIKKIKSKIDSTSKKVQKLNAQLAIENALLDEYEAELQRLEGRINVTPEHQESQTEIKDTDDEPQTEINNVACEPQPQQTNISKKNRHTGLYDKFVLWPIGYCRYHSCVLDDVDVIKRKCILRRGRAGICRHFDFLDENGNIIEISMELYASRKSRKVAHNANIETPAYESEYE